MPDLGLQTLAHTHLGFLKTRGYEPKESHPYRVRFEAPTTFIELVFDSTRSYELGLLVGKKDLEAAGHPPFSLDEILRLHHAPEARRITGLQITSREALASSVEIMAQLLRTYGEDFIAGNDVSFKNLATQRRRESESYALERDLRLARTDAEIAWQKKDYAGVVRVLKPLRAALTAAEVGKLEFAEKHLRDAHMK